MSGAEFSRLIRLDTLGGAPRTIAIEADVVERAALAARFALLSIGRLDARATLRREGDVVCAEGDLHGEATQACIATGEPVPAHVVETFNLRFVPEARAAGADEIELEEGDLDEIAYAGGAIDLGEAVAQGFALALDPFPRSPGADATLAAAGVLSEEQAEVARQEASPFAVLKGLTDPKD